MAISITISTVRVFSTANNTVDFTGLGHVAGSKLYAVFGSKPASALASALSDAGFSKVGDHASTTGISAGNDAGDTNVEIWEKTSDGTETTVTATNGTNSVTWGWCFVVDTDNPSGLQPVIYMESEDNTSGNNTFQATFASQTYDVGDRVVWVATGPTDAMTASLIATPSGFTANASMAPSSTSNKDAGGQDICMMGQVLQKATSSATVGITCGFTGITGSTNTYGPFAALVFKEAAAATPLTAQRVGAPVF